MTRDQVMKTLRQSCKKAGSQAAWAKAHNLSPAYVADTLAGNRGSGIVGDGILKALGLERVVTYRKVKPHG